jgi:hypothetical protein
MHARTLTAAAIAALLPLGFGRPILTSLWFHLPLPGGGHYDLGTTTLFDLGVYLVVVGATLLILVHMGLMHDASHRPTGGDGAPIDARGEGVEGRSDQSRGSGAAGPSQASVVTPLD